MPELGSESLAAGFDLPFLSPWNALWPATSPAGPGPGLQLIRHLACCQVKILCLGKDGTLVKPSHRLPSALDNLFCVFALI